ncbi:inosine monophosphate dehydrogenase [Dothidotthia symphoricarpi CBS 119687]|uniref:Inosine monophosphate dehydrogenase n=1 Tax=Dothidotthia symphoricarpi CBS 119687 TaxID=1392245 RepID=A0A6A6ATI7_9PLEO|nr:inosine monophosphate dehydrogenase [Dothidotthia symphoricarpi CBS 119687]KAF2134980.1 inosine monophosphate dehydrogenase [Dothidotthia symphoricarpi CBS 119687]
MPPPTPTLPWTTTPLLINAPMANFAGGALASAVSLAGGLGMIGCLTSTSDLRRELDTAATALSSHTFFQETHSLPIGVGFLTFLLKLDDILPLVREYRPAVIWLFAAPHVDEYAAWSAALRTASPGSSVWIQTGSVDAALQICRTAAPDVLCMQGADAGGHGFEKGAGVISLVPETADALAREGFAHVPLVAAGGIVDGRGVAAALALGAAGVVMGTRFLASREVVVHARYQAAVLEARDGGQVTTRSRIFDELRGPNVWPEAYDGRSLVVRSYRDHVGGVGVEEIRRLYGEAVEEEDRGWKTGLQGRAAIWAGTGVGLVREVLGAGEIVERVRGEARDTLGRLARL